MKTTFSKNHFLIFACSLVFITAGCKKLNLNKELRIDMGAHFQNDLVTISLDDEVIFSDTVTTNHVLGVAKILNFDHPIGEYTITVNVDDVEKSDVFRHKTDRFIYISYDESASKINITYPNEKYFYD